MRAQAPSSNDGRADGSADQANIRGQAMAYRHCVARLDTVLVQGATAMWAGQGSGAGKGCRLQSTNDGGADGSKDQVGMQWHIGIVWQG